MVNCWTSPVVWLVSEYTYCMTQMQGSFDIWTIPSKICLFADKNEENTDIIAMTMDQSIEKLCRS